MNLPDYSRCVEFFRLHQEMGIRFIPHVPAIDVADGEVLEMIRELPDPEDAAFGSRLLRESVPVMRDEVTLLPNEPLNHRGRVVCVYLRDQHDSVAFEGQWRRYYYHLFFCQVLQRMKSAATDLSLLATQRSDGVFEVHDLSGGHPRRVQASLGLCPDCRGILQERGVYSSGFQLANYFKLLDTYKIRKLHEVAAAAEPEMSERGLADVYRQVCAYMCQACGVDCASATQLLHLHFSDGDPTHTARENLHILCVDCHAQQPGHDHMAVQPVVQDSIEMVRERRASQGIVMLR
jgi:hypothetical protein